MFSSKFVDQYFNVIIYNFVGSFALNSAHCQWRVSPDPSYSLCNFSAIVGSWRNTLRNMMLLVGLWQQEFQQGAQLSQRDRAAGCVIILTKVEDWNWETIFYGQYRSMFNYCDIIGLKICRIRWKTQNKGYYGVRGHSRSSRSVPVESPN